VRTTADLLDDESAQELGGDNSFATLRRHLSSLRLQTLLLPIGFKQALGQGLRTALAVLPSGLASDPPPLLVQWASSLTHLRCEIALDSEDALFTAFATSPWPQLRKLQLTMRCLCWCVFPVPSPHAIAVASLARALSSRNAPGLTSLELNLDCRSRSRWAKNLPPCPCDNVWQQLLPSVRSLTELRISIGLLRPSMALLEFLQLICTDAMPLLQRLVWGSGQLQPIDAVDHPLMISFLQRMRSLTSIHAVGGLVRSSRGPVKCFELLHHVHDLPSLRDVCADGAQWGVRSERGVGGCAVEVADVRQLESLTCAAVEVMPLLQRWWRHLGRPELRVNGELVAPHKWEEHVAQRTAREAASTASVGIPVATGAESMARQQLPAIRRLKLCASSLRQIRYEFTSPIAFSYLGRLPHLRELDCFVHVWYLDALASMTQLESLTLTLSDEWSSERKAQWNDEMVRTLGGMPLQRLHTLRLEGSNESDATNVYRSARPQDSDFPCQTPIMRSALRSARSRAEWSSLTSRLSFCLFVLHHCRGRCVVSHKRRRCARLCGRTQHVPRTCHLCACHAGGIAPLAQTARVDVPELAVD
jgi:hypothetical protein